MPYRILLIDDDQDDADIFQEALAETDSTAIFVHFDDGNEALQQLTDNDLEHPHFIFIDINMPALNGWDCLRAFKKNSGLKHIPVIMYSTASNSRDEQKAKELGAIGLVSKPHDYKALKEKLKVVIAHA